MSERAVPKFSESSPSFTNNKCFNSQRGKDIYTIPMFNRFNMTVHLHFYPKLGNACSSWMFGIGPCLAPDGLDLPSLAGSNNLTSPDAKFRPPGGTYAFVALGLSPFFSVEFELS